MRRRAEPIPAFATEAEERRFWEGHDSTEYVDWSKAERVRLPNVRPSTASISLRMPVTLLERIKTAAHKRDVPYQSLIKRSGSPRSWTRAERAHGWPRGSKRQDEPETGVQLAELGCRQAPRLRQQTAAVEGEDLRYVDDRRPRETGKSC